MRRSIYYRPEYQRIIVYDIKEPFKRLISGLGQSSVNPLRLIRLAREIIALYRAVGRLPEPTVENVGHPNSVILCRIRDYWFSSARLPYLMRPMRRAVDAVIIIYDTDFYRSFIDVWAREIRASPWRAMGPLQPDPQFWEEGERPYSEPLRLTESDCGRYLIASRYGPEDSAEARQLLSV